MPSKYIHPIQAPSCLRGNVSDGCRPPVQALPSLDRSGSSSDVILPKWIYIKDRDGRYLAVDPIASLTFRSGAPDLNCAFETIPNGASSFKLLGRSGRRIVRWTNIPEPINWYATVDTSTSQGLTFLFIVTRGNKVYIKDKLSPSLFMSNQLMSGDWTGVVAREFLNEDSEMEISIAAVKNEIIGVQYDINSGKVRDTAPLIALSTSVRNDSDGEVNQTLSYTYEKWIVGTWNNAAGIEIGASTTFKAGVPFVGSAEFEISISASYTHEWGGENGVREVINTSTTVTVPPKKKAHATVIVRNAQIDVDFTYTQRVLWSNGETEDKNLKGIYTNVDSWDVDVVLDNWEDV